MLLDNFFILFLATITNNNYHGIIRKQNNAHTFNGKYEILTEAIQSQLTKFGYSSSVVDGAEYPNGNNKNGEGGSLNFKSS